MKAVLIGAGNVAWHLGPALQRAGLEWVQVYSRNLERARKMALRLKDAAGKGPGENTIACTCREEEIFTDADFYLFAVTDDALRDMASRLRFYGAVAVHVSGSVPLDTLRKVSARCGVLYPFQTFSTTAPCPDLSRTPLCIEASDEATLQSLRALAEKISGDGIAKNAGNIRETNSAQRAALHLAGVFACNYTNFMYKAAYDIMREADMEFDLLLPLITQTACKQDGGDPALYQTGPAVRGDKEILRKQEAALGSTEKGRRYLEIYKLLAQALCQTTRKNSPK